MNKEQGIEMQIADYFKQSQPQQIDREEILHTLMDNIDVKKQRRSEKALIACLLERIETESDSVKLQFYRQALEILLRGNR